MLLRAAAVAIALYTTRNNPNSDEGLVPERIAICQERIKSLTGTVNSIVLGIITEEVFRKLPTDDEDSYE